MGDILAPPSLAPALAGCEAALNLATSVPRPGAPRDFVRNDAIRRDGTRHFIAACRGAGVERLVQQSIAHLVAGHGDAIVDETATLNPAGATASAVEMEAAVEESGLRWTILRGGAFYGAGTGRDEEWRGLARAGKLFLPGDGSAYVSLIHATDMADAVGVLAAERAPPDAVLSIVNDEPVTWRTLFAYIAALEDGPEPQPGGPAGTPSSASPMRAPALRWADGRGCRAIARALPERAASRGLFIVAAVA